MKQAKLKRIATEAYSSNKKQHNSDSHFYSRFGIDKQNFNEDTQQVADHIINESKNIPYREPFQSRNLIHEFKNQDTYITPDKKNTLITPNKKNTLASHQDFTPKVQEKDYLKHKEFLNDKLKIPNEEPESPKPDLDKVQEDYNEISETSIIVPNESVEGKDYSNKKEFSNNTLKIFQESESDPTDLEKVQTVDDAVSQSSIYIPSESVEKIQTLLRTNSDQFEEIQNTE